MQSANISDISDSGHLRKSRCVLIRLSPAQYRLLQRAAVAESGLRGEEIRASTLARYLVVRGAREVLRAAERAAIKSAERREQRIRDELPPREDDDDDDLDV